MYYFNEGSLELPQEWQDKTIHIFSATKDNNSNGLSFTISRDNMPWGMAFDEFAEREIVSLSRQLKNYRQLNKQTGTLAEHHMVSNEFSWDAEQGHIHQYMVFIDTKPQVLIFTATMVGLLSEQQKEKIDVILQTLKLNERTE